MKPFDIPVVAGPQPFRLVELTADKLYQGPPPPIRWLVKDIFPRGKVALLASAPGTGKSFSALDLCVKATGAAGNLPFAFGGLVEARGRAVLVSGEDDGPEIHRRLHGLMQGRPMPSRLHVLTLPDVRTFGGILEIDPDTRKLQVTGAWRQLAEEIQAIDDVAVVVLDTMQSTLGAGDLNGTEAAQAIMNELTALAAKGPAVIAIHHVTKGRSDSKDAQSVAESIRGSSALTGSARAAYVMVHTPEERAREVCQVLNLDYEPGRVVTGWLVKTNGPGMKKPVTFVRNDTGLLVDRTLELGFKLGGERQNLLAELLTAITTASAAGEPFAYTAHAAAGLFTRAHELPEPLSSQSKLWFTQAAGELVATKQARKVKRGNGFVLAPMEGPESEKAPP